MLEQRKQKKNEPKKPLVEGTEENPARKRAAAAAKFYLLCLLGVWVFSLLVNIISDVLFLLGQYYNKDNIIINSVYSFWFPEIGFVLTYGTLSFVIIIWGLLLVGTNRMQKIEVSTNLADVSKFIYFMLTVLAVGTIVSLGVVQPYCFPAFQTTQLNQQCVIDKTDTRIFEFRWALFGIRLFVIVPVLILISYLWITLRPGSLGCTHVKLNMYRQMMEVLIGTQIFLYLLQTMIEWVLVFYPDMDYSDFKTLCLVGGTVPNILVIVFTIFMMKRIKGKQQTDAYHEME